MARSQPYNAANLRGGIRAFLEGHAVAGAIGVLVALAMVRTMPPEQFAVYAVIPSFVVLLNELAGFGLPAAVARFVPEARLTDSSGALARLVWRLLAWRIGITAIVVGVLAVFTPQIARLLNLAHASEAVLVGFGYLLAYATFSHLQKTLEALVAQDDLKRGMLADWVPKAGIVLVWLTLAGTMTAAQAIGVHALTAAGGAAVMAWLLARRLRSMHAGAAAGEDYRPDRAALRECARNQFVQTLLVMPTDAQGIRVLAAPLLSTATVAGFGFHQIFASMVSRYLPVQLFIGLVDSLVVARYLETKRFEAVSDISAALFKLNLFVVVPAFIGSIVIGAPLTAFLTGGKYVELAWLMPIMLAAIACESLWFLVRAGANAVGRTDLLVHGGAAALAVLALALGATLAGWLSSLAMLAIVIVATPAVRAGYVMIALARRSFVYRFDWLGIGRIVLLAAVAVGAAHGCALALTSGELARMLVTLALAVGLYPAIAMAWRPFSQRERELLGRITGKWRFPW